MVEVRGGKTYSVTWIIEVESINDLDDRKPTCWVPVAECRTERDMKAKYKWLGEMLVKRVFRGNQVRWRRVAKEIINF